MKPYGLVTLVLALLQHLRCVSYRALKVQFDLDDEELEALRFEIVEAQRLAADLDGKMLLWTGEGHAPAVPVSRGTAAEAPALDRAAASRGLPPLGTASGSGGVASAGGDEAAVSASEASPAEPLAEFETASPGASDDARAQAGTSPPPEPLQKVAEAERRQLTVMFCDLVGSTPLSEQLDPEQLRDVLRSYQETCHEVINQFDGHVARYFGDGLLVYFGYPRAHEDDAQRAVHSGLGILEAMTRLNEKIQPEAGVRLEVRIGIHTGLVVAGDMDADRRLESMAIVGDTPNVAARIQGAAAPNTVVISAATARLLREAFELEDLGPHELKGLAEPVTLAKVLAPAQAQVDTAEITPDYVIPLVGRDEEVGLLRRRWDQSKEGLGQVVLVSGQGGIGKSRLLDALHEHVADDRHVRVAYYCSPYHTNSALYPVITHLHRLLQFQPNDPPAARLDKLERTLGTYSLPLEESVPLFASLLSVPLLDRYPPPALTPQQQRQQTLDALVAWMLEEAERQPVLLIWEDLQWADPSTLEMLGLLIDQAPTAPVLNVLTHRPEFVLPWPHRTHMTPITLNRLERPQTEAMIRHLAGGKPLPAEVVQHIVTKADGVPLYVEEMTKMILESDALREESGRYVLTRELSEVAIPATLQDSLMARLDRVPTVREVAQVAAVFGREFAYQMLQLVAAVDEETLQAGLDKLVEAELLYQRGRGQRARYMFKHALIRDAAYGSLLKVRRQQYHEQIAKMIEKRLSEVVETQPELLAHHYEEAGRDEQAIRYWQRAGERALARSASLEAIHHLKKGLDRLEALPEGKDRDYYELRLLTTLGPALMATEGYAAPETERVYNRARELCQHAGETPDSFPVLAGLWRFHLLRAEYSMAQEFAEQLLKLAKRLDDRAFLLEANRALGSTLFYRGEFARARVHLEEGIRLYDPQGHRNMGFRYGQDPAVACRSYASWVLWLTGYTDQALEESERAIAWAKEIKHPFSLAMALSFASWLHQFCGDRKVTRERAEAALALSTEQKFQFWVGWDAMLQCWAQAGQGTDDELIARMRDSLDVWLATGSELGRPYFLALLSEVCVEAGQPDEGMRLLEQALEIAGKTGERWWEAEQLRLRGELCLREGGGCEADAERFFEQAIDVSRRQEARSLELRAVVSLGRLRKARGQVTEAQQLLEEVCDRLAQSDVALDLQGATALLGELH